VGHTASPSHHNGSLSNTATIADHSAIGAEPRMLSPSPLAVADCRHGQRIVNPAHHSQNEIRPRRDRAPASAYLAARQRNRPRRTARVSCKVPAMALDPGAKPRWHTAQLKAAAVDWGLPNRPCHPPPPIGSRQLRRDDRSAACAADLRADPVNAIRAAGSIRPWPQS